MKIPTLRKYSFLKLKWNLCWGFQVDFHFKSVSIELGPRGCKKGDSPFGEDYEDDADEDWGFGRKKRSLFDDNNRRIVEKPGEIFQLDYTHYV